jgi:hypothetical protein
MNGNEWDDEAEEEMRKEYIVKQFVEMTGRTGASKQCRTHR